MFRYEFLTGFDSDVVIIAQHVCPACGHSEPAPFNGVIQGDAGIWCCQICQKAFRIRIDFQPVTEEEIRRAIDVKRIEGN